MHVAHLSLTNFRNYTRLELDLSSGVTLFHGDNAHGKTNLLEALYYLATTRSPHTTQDPQLVNWDAAEAEEPVVVGRLVADVSRSDETRRVEMRLIQEQRGNYRNGQSFRREVLVNRRKVRLMDLLGNLRVVLFVPEDVQLVTGTPSVRRRYMNVTLCQIDPEYCRALSHYNKVLEQRNALLRQMAEGRRPKSALDLLSILSEKLVTYGSTILCRRAAFVHEMGRETQRIYYEDLIGGRESVRLGYLPRSQAAARPPNGREDPQVLLAEGEWLQDNRANGAAVLERLTRAVNEARQTDIARGSTSVGPHRDDWTLLINGRDLGLFGSRGQQRSAIMALKLAEINWMRAETEEMPLLLLDEVIAELDIHRRSQLLAYILEVVEQRGPAQAMLTATETGIFTPEFLEKATLMTVANGRVTPDAR
jgi:DNA replication and repair protein RecF